MEKTKIQWTDATVNLWWGCVEVAKGCDHCYAAALSQRFGHDVWGARKARRPITGAWDLLDKLQRTAVEESGYTKVFVGSMMDIFERDRPVESRPFGTGELRKRFFGNIQLGMYPNLVFQLLTKRPSNIPSMIPEEWYEGCPSNVWFGTSAADQAEVDTFIPTLASSAPPGANLFVSLEPLLEEVNIAKHLANIDTLRWVIVGGESGAKARPFDIHWPRLLISQCKRHDRKVFIKQLGRFPVAGKWKVRLRDAKGGDLHEWPEDIQVREEMPVEQEKLQV